MSIHIAGVVTNGVVVPDSPLPEGARVEVIVVPSERPMPHRMSVLEVLESLPAGSRAFPTWDEYERHLQEEKDSWDR